MSRKNLVIIFTVAVLLTAVVLTKGFFGKNEVKSSGKLNNVSISKSSDNDKVDLKTRYKLIKNSKKPCIIVFSYEADCCPSTKQFFDQYNSKIKKIINDYICFRSVCRHDRPGVAEYRIFKLYNCHGTGSNGIMAFEGFPV